MSKISDLKVLVIDDSYVNRQLMKSILEGRCLQIIEAGDGLEAIEILDSSDKPDLIILDLMMPVMDGVETLRRIRERNHNLPVLVITADIQEENRIKCMELGISGFINKPIHRTQVIKIIEDVLLTNDIKNN